MRGQWEAHWVFELCLNVMQRGDNLAISTELVDARDNSHIWGEQYSRKSADIFALQGEIAKEMTAALRVRLTGDEEKRLTKSYTADPEAYQLYLKGRFWSEKATEYDRKRGIEYFQQAIAKDPKYALAYTGLSTSYRLLGAFEDVAAYDTYTKAKEAALKALQIDGTLAEAHGALGIIAFNRNFDWATADRELKRAVELDPNSAEVHLDYGPYLAAVGRLDEALEERKRAVELDPLSLSANVDLTSAYDDLRQYDRAIKQGRQTVAMDPNFVTAHYRLGIAYLGKNNYKLGVAELEQAHTLSQTNNLIFAALGYAYAVSGEDKKAHGVLAEFKASTGRSHGSPFYSAIVYSGLGDKNEAIESLQKAYEDAPITMAYIKISFFFDSLRSDPRFNDLLRRMNLQP